MCAILQLVSAPLILDQLQTILGGATHYVSSYWTNISIGKENRIETVKLNPFLDFYSCRFCIFAKIAIRSIYPPSVQIPM